MAINAREMASESMLLEHGGYSSPRWSSGTSAVADVAVANGRYWPRRGSVERRRGARASGIGPGRAPSYSNPIRRHTGTLATSARRRISASTMSGRRAWAWLNSSPSLAK
jgi:hypothetical protein